ncbi:MAG: Arc family DNA-binding protein [Succiniclasticum sp.]|nr:Arc family DNA-binding protein [Succiniclasticum sp.]
MCAMEQSRFTLRIHPLVMAKMKYIAERNGRSVNKEIEQILKWVIDDFESKRGHIVLEDDEQTGYRDTQTEKDLAKASRNHPVSDMLFHLK